MNYYPLLEIQGFGAEVQLANFPSNGDYESPINPVVVYAAQTTGSHWSIYDCGELLPWETRIYSRADLNGEENPLESIFFFMSEQSLPNILSALPMPSLFQNTEPAWRGNLRVVGNGTVSSYSGDYPDSLAKLENATLLSLSPMIQKCPGITTRVLIINLCLCPTIREVEARLITLAERSTLQTYRLRTNRVNVLSVDENLVHSASATAVTCEGMTGIPVFVSYNLDRTMISMEHTHPPAEMMVFGSGSARRAIVRGLKDHFLEKGGN